MFVFGIEFFATRPQGCDNRPPGYVCPIETAASATPEVAEPTVGPTMVVVNSDGQEVHLPCGIAAYHFRYADLKAVAATAAAEVVRGPTEVVTASGPTAAAALGDVVAPAVIPAADPAVFAAQPGATRATSAHPALDEPAFPAQLPLGVSNVPRYDDRPHWEGDPQCVPTSPTIRADPRLNAASYAGSAIWFAMANTHAAHLHDGNAEREALSQHYKSRAWKEEFMHRHRRYFPDQPGINLSAQMFDLALYTIPAVRQLAARDMDQAGVERPVSAWYPWLAWESAVAHDPDAAGLCYLRLIPAEQRAVAATQLGHYPNADRVATYIRRTHLPDPGAFRASIIDGFGHILGDDEPGGTLYRLPGSVGPGPAPLTGNPSLGAPNVEPAGEVVAAGSHVVVRIVLSAEVNYKFAVGDIEEIITLAERWSDVRLTRITARITGDEDGAVLRVGLSSAARRGAVPLGDTQEADVLRCDVCAIADQFSAGVGNTSGVLVPPPSIDRQLSIFAAPSGGQRPDLTVSFVPAGSALAEIELHLTVAGTALCFANIPGASGAGSSTTTA